MKQRRTPFPVIYKTNKQKIVENLMNVAETNKHLKAAAALAFNKKIQKNADNAERLFIIPFQMFQKFTHCKSDNGDEILEPKPVDVLTWRRLKICEIICWPHLLEFVTANPYIKKLALLIKEIHIHYVHVQFDLYYNNLLTCNHIQYVPIYMQCKRNFELFRSKAILIENCIVFRIFI